MPLAKPVRRTLLVLGVLAPWSWFLVRDLRPSINALAVLLPAIAIAGTIAMVVLAAIVRRPGPLLVAVSGVAMTTVAVMGPRVAHEATEPAVPLTIAFANVYDENHDPEGAIRDLLARDTDIVVVAEATAPFRDAIEATDTEHRFQFDDGQLLVHARWPVQFLGTPTALPEGRSMLVRLLPPGVTPISLLVVHAPNPSSATTFAAQTRQMEQNPPAGAPAGAGGPGRAGG